MGDIIELKGESIASESDLDPDNWIYYYAEKVEVSEITTADGWTNEEEVSKLILEQFPLKDGWSVSFESEEWN